MLYSEFIEGTGCRDNEHNMKVYKDLEIMYMNSDMSKAEIYEYGKKLVDNRESEESLRIKAQWKAEIAEYKEVIKGYKNDIEWRKEMLVNETEKEYRDMWKHEIKWRNEEIRRARVRINELKWLLNA